MKQFSATKFIFMITFFSDYFVWLSADLVAIVDDGGDLLTSKLTTYLKNEGIHIAEIIAYDHPLLSKTLSESDSQIIVSLVGNKQLRKGAHVGSLIKTKKIWITLDLDMVGMTHNDESKAEDVDFLVAKAEKMGWKSDEIKLQLITIRQHHNSLSEFSAYFLRVLKNNYESFSLLSAYVQQVFNCTVKPMENEIASVDCPDIESKDLGADHKISKHVEGLLKVVYALALAARNIEKDSNLKQLCATPSLQCYEAIIKEVLVLNYEFGAEDPTELRGQSLKFHQFETEYGSVAVLSDISIEAVLIEREGRDGTMLYKLLEMKTDAEPKFMIHSIPTKLRSIPKSLCQPYRHYCGKCSGNTKRMEEDSMFLSNPQQYALFLTGIFDFHEGPNCEILLRESVALPLAFVYTMWSSLGKDKVGLLPGVDIGAILVDSCSSDRSIMEFLVDSENGCYKFAQADRNWTVVPGATFGYISTSSIPSSLAASPPPPSVVQRFFASKNSPAPVIAVDGHEHTKGQLFTTMPSHKGLAQALVKWLKRMRWEYVNVVVDKSNTDSLAQFHQFELFSNGICIAQVIDNPSASVPTSTNSAATNVTILFTSAKSAADYLSNRLRQWNGDPNTQMPSPVHVVMGDAHDFHLHDPTNLAHYAGVVSVQPRDVLRSDFKQWLEGVTPLTLPETWFWRHVEEYWHCALSLRNKDLYQGRMCTGDELLNIPQMGRMTKAGYLAKSVEAFLIAADLVHKKLCGNQPGICTQFAQHGRLNIRKMLADMSVEEEFEILEFQPIDHHGNFGYNLLANYSREDGFHQFDSYKSYANGVQLVDVSPPMSRCHSPLCKCSNNNHFDQFAAQRRFASSSKHREDQPLNDDAALRGSYIQKVAASGNPTEELLVYDADIESPTSEEWLSRETFKYLFLSLTTIFTVLAVATLILVIVKMYFRIVKGNQSLGIMLLLGIILLFATSYAYISEASDTICRCRIVMHAIAHTVCFGVMIVKAVQLQNTETLQGHRLSYWNYWLLLTFILIVQFAICLRWLIEPFSSSADIPALSASHFRCSYSSANFFLAEAYSFLLLLLSLLLNSLNRNIKRNYKEAKWLFGASLCSAIVMAAWISFQAFASPAFVDYITILELYFCGTILLTFLFGPKIYVLLSYEPVLVECTFGGDNYGAAQKSLDLFEAEWSPGSRATSPSIQSTRTASPISPAMSGSGQKPKNGQMNGSNSSAYNSDDGLSSSMFQTVLRKKNFIRRSQSENEQNIQRAGMPCRLPAITVTSLDNPHKVKSSKNMHSPPPAYQRRY
ncbi:7 transmembrane sweet-taste receptor of 3 GCPR domain-containing protein [Ditylenchus destructor]|nr:7 transmembrane sweet-taste receptor of 3 GCPR domain-containing protein [Ditylenchus destructor]